MTFKLLTAAGAAALAAPGLACAQTASSADVRCIVVTFLAAGASKDPQVVQMATMAGLYYVGKVDGAAPATDLEARIREEAGKMSPNDMAAEGRRCGDELVKRGQDLQDLGDRLKGAAPPRAPKS